jgi:hypothetical protein
LSLAVICACAGSSEWTSEEKANALHYLRAAEADIAASQLVNQRGGPDITAAVPEILRLKRTALMEAQQVRDSVLEKALPGLSEPYRLLFQRSLELQIRNLERGDLEAEITGSALHDEWVDWISAPGREVRIPK